MLTPEKIADLRELLKAADGGPYGCVLADKAIAALPVLLDELEAARKVVKAAKSSLHSRDYGQWGREEMDLDAALAAYEEATK